MYHDIQTKYEEELQNLGREHSMSENNLKKSMHDKENEIMKLKNNLKNMDIKLQDFASQNMNLTEELLKIKDDNKKFRDESIKMRKDMDNLVKEESNAENASEFYKYSAERAQTELKQHQEDKANITNLHTQLAEMSAELEKARRDLASQQSHNSELQKMIDRGNLSSGDMQKEWSASITKLTRELTETSALYNQYYTKSMKLQSELEETHLELTNAQNNVVTQEKALNDRIKNVGD